MQKQTWLKCWTKNGPGGVWIKVIDPKYIKNSNESCTFWADWAFRAVIKKTCSLAKSLYFWGCFFIFFGRNRYKIEVSVHWSVRTIKWENYKTINWIFLSQARLKYTELICVPEHKHSFYSTCDLTLAQWLGTGQGRAVAGNDSISGLIC